MGWWTRSLRALSVAVLVCCSLAEDASGAASTRHYSNTRFGYSFSYPASWIVQPSADPATVQLRSPDQATTFTIRVVAGTLAQPALHTVLVHILQSLLNLPARTTQPLTYTQITQPAGTAAQAEGRATVSGAHRFAIARVVSYTGYLYLFFGLGPTPPSVSFDAPALALHAIISTITIAPLRVLFSRPSTYFSLYYPRGWRAVAYPALGKIVEHGPGGALIFADFGHEAANPFDLRLLLLENVSLMGKIQGQVSFSVSSVDGKPVQVVSVNIVDTQGHHLVATVADASLNGFNYVFGGAAPKGSPEEFAVIDTIGSATMQPPALPPDTGAFVTFSSAVHHYSLQRPAAWIASEHDSATDAVFAARDGNLTLSILTRPGTVTTVLAQLSRNVTQGFTSVTQLSAPARLGRLAGEERTIKATLVKGLIQETHLVAASSGATVYVLNWSFYSSAPDAQALQHLVRRAQASFTIHSS